MKLYYNKLGSDSKGMRRQQPLFIVHGLFGMSDNWLTVGKKLAENFEVYLLDLRNFGQSLHSDAWTYPAMAKDIQETMDDVLGLMANGKNTSTIKHQPLPILIGHSLGGKVAMQFASLFPQMLEKLIVVDIAPKDLHPKVFDFVNLLPAIDLSKMKSRKEVETELGKILKENSIIQLLLKNIQWTPHPQSLSTEERSSSQRLDWKFNLKAIVNNMNMIGDTFKLKEKIETPTLFIRAENSDYILEEDIPSIKKTFPNSEFKTIAGAGHWVHADKPVEFAETIREFTSLES